MVNDNPVDLFVRKATQFGLFLQKETREMVEDLKQMNLMSMNLKHIMISHGLSSLVLGVMTIFLPHNFYTSKTTGYNHMAHEYVRLYGVMCIGIGYIVLATRNFKDARLLRTYAETFTIIYILQALAMLRAQFTLPTGHSLLHWLIAMMYLLQGFMYAYFRFTKNLIKSYELPGVSDSRED